MTEVNPTAGENEDLNEDFFEASQKFKTSLVKTDDSCSDASDCSFHSMTQNLDEFSLDDSLTLPLVDEIHPQPMNAFHCHEDTNNERCPIQDTTNNEWCPSQITNSNERFPTYIDSIEPPNNLTSCDSFGKAVEPSLEKLACTISQLVSEASLDTTDVPINLQTTSQEAVVKDSTECNTTQDSSQHPKTNSKAQPTMILDELENKSDNVLSDDDFDICCIDSVKVKDEEWELRIKDRDSLLNEEELKVLYSMIHLP